MQNLLLLILLLVLNGSRHDRWSILVLSLNHHLPVLEISILSIDRLPQLLKAFGSYLKAFRMIDLALIIAEEDERFEEVT